MIHTDFVTAILRASDEATVRGLLHELCRVGGTGFAALACVVGSRWITCQVLDSIDFGLNPGDELELQTTVCNDIVRLGRAVVVDDIDADPNWRTHPVPLMHGFKSCASFPVVLDDGRLFGTLCTIDLQRRPLSRVQTLERMHALADRAARILSYRVEADLRRGMGYAPANDTDRPAALEPVGHAPPFRR